MTDHATESRFIVRKGTVQDTWMVWDRTIRGPTRLGTAGIATGLSEERARELTEHLKTAHDEK